MNTKVIYIFLLCSPLCREHIWCGGTSFWKRVGVFASTGEMSERAEKEKQTTLFFLFCFVLLFCFFLKAKNCRAEYTVIIKQGTRGRALSGANPGQSVFHFSRPSHQIHRGRPLEQIIPFKQHRRKPFTQVAFIFPSPQRWKGIIHHDSASGHWPSSVNSLLSFLMYYADTVRRSVLVKGTIISPLNAIQTFKKS